MFFEAIGLDLVDSIQFIKLCLHIIAILQSNNKT